MNSERPKIKVPLQTIDIVIELASITILLLMWIHIILEYSGLPETIPSHFNGAGEADGMLVFLF